MGREDGDDTRVDSRRRRLLAVLGATGAAGLAGCGGGGDGGTPTARPTATPTEPATETATPTEEPAAVFDVSGLDPVDPTVGYGETVEVSATITNTGSVEGTQAVEYRVDGETVDSASTTLTTSAIESVAFTAAAADFEVGEYAHGVYTEDDEETGTLTVEGLPALDDPLLAIDATALEPGTNTVAGALENDYPFEVTDGQVSLTVPDGWSVASESGTTFEALESDGSQDVSWEIEVPEGTEGEHDLTATVTYAAADETTEVETTHTVTVVPDAWSYAWSAADYDVDETPDDSWAPKNAIDSWTVAEDGDGKHLLITSPEGDLGLLRFTDAPPAAAVEVRTTLKVTDEGDINVYTRGEDDSPDTMDATRFDDHPRSDSHRLSQYTNRQWEELASMDRVVDAGQAVTMRGQVEGSSIRAKFWAPDEDEPEEWQLETEVDVTDDGYTGVSHWIGESFRVYDFEARAL